MLLILFLCMTCAGPIWVFFAENIQLTQAWYLASRKPACIAPDPLQTHEAVIQVYAARAFSWRGLFAVHTWIAIKTKDANAYTVYQVIGWRAYRGLPALEIKADIPDRLWYGQKPHIIRDVRGKQAEALIPEITRAIDTYPYAKHYVFWPGPNSNTFPAYVGRQVPALKLVLPSTAIGQHFLSDHRFCASTPSGTGYACSLWGVLGLTVAKAEGITVHILGLDYGINPYHFSLILPGVGEIMLWNWSSNAS